MQTTKKHAIHTHNAVVQYFNIGEQGALCKLCATSFAEPGPPGQRGDSGDPGERGKVIISLARTP